MGKLNHSKFLSTLCDHLSDNMETPEDLKPFLRDYEDSQPSPGNRSEQPSWHSKIIVAAHVRWAFEAIVLVISLATLIVAIWKVQEKDELSCPRLPCE